MENQEEQGSVADWVREAATSFIDSLIPEGFELVPEYGTYYSRSTGYFFDPNTRLYYHPATECYYEFDETSGEFRTHAVFKPGKWSRQWKRRARGVLGRTTMKAMDQESVDAAETVLELVSRVTGYDAKENDTEAQLERQRRKLKLSFAARNPIYDEDMGLFYHQPRQPSHQTEPISDSSGEEDSESEEDERNKLIEEERMHEAPCIRMIDDLARLHVVTINGGYLGTGFDCDVRIDRIDPYVAEKHIAIVYDAEAGHYRLEVRSPKGIVLVDEQPVQMGEACVLEHGAVIRLNNRYSFLAHVHHGSNTCAGCEPGILRKHKGGERAVMFMPSRETQRRRQLKMLKSMWSINDYAERPSTSGNYMDRARTRRTEVGSEHPAERRKGRAEDAIYAGCAAKPLPGATMVHTPVSGMAVPLTTENKGFKLLKSMGWREGEGLGKEGVGRVEPVRTEVKNNRVGLGHSSSGGGPPPAKSKRQDILDKTRERFNRIKD